MPPESVITRVACLSKHKNSMYHKGSTHMILSVLSLLIMVSILSRDLGWAGNIVVCLEGILITESINLVKASVLSTFEGLCKVRTLYGITSEVSDGRNSN